MVLNDFRHLRPLLQISPAHPDEISGSLYATFKCLGCRETFGIAVEDTWLFCPKCGSNGGMIRREVKSKKYHDNFGVYQQINGKWVHVKAPVWTMVIEFKWDNDWEEYDGKRIKGTHRELKYGMKQLNKGDRFRLIPSLPLSLP